MSSIWVERSGKTASVSGGTDGGEDSGGVYLNNEAGVNFTGDVDAFFDGELGAGAFLEGEGGTGVNGEKSGTECDAMGVAISSASG